MKYTLILIVAFLLTSCGASYQANQVEKEFKGDWILESVTYPDSSGLFDVELFNVAEASCFDNSTWKFVPNNSTGSFILDGDDCSKTEQQFTWYIDKATAQNINPEMLLKVTTGQKARKVDTGTRIKIKSLLADQMIWEQSVMFNGKQIKIQMTFSKF